MSGVMTGWGSELTDEVGFSSSGAACVQWAAEAAGRAESALSRWVEPRRSGVGSAGVEATRSKVRRCTSGAGTESWRLTNAGAAKAAGALSSLWSTGGSGAATATARPAAGWTETRTLSSIGRRRVLVVVLVGKAARMVRVGALLRGLHTAHWGRDAAAALAAAGGRGTVCSHGGPASGPAGTGADASHMCRCRLVRVVPGEVIF